jgi:hypothetical protein
VDVETVRTGSVIIAVALIAHRLPAWSISPD